MSAPENKPKEEFVLYGQFPGVTGDAVGKASDKYSDWIKLSSFQFGVGMGIGSPGRRRGYRNGSDDEDEPEIDENNFPERECSDASVSEITVTKEFTPSSPFILFQSTAKKVMDVVTLDLVREEEGKSTPVLRYVLKSVYISGFSISYGGRGRGNNKDESSLPNESLSLNFCAMELISFNKDGQTNASTSYHLAATVATLKTGPNLEVADKYKKTKKPKETKQES
eukprot:TRINITY_DN14079_c0_g1_i1.p1 TRINITY_DN14079_c0_g1~~TRINITY_DN14079_c0_g1_i1.p1  ORF type:complete len:262 (+),score=65.16 TRINITY_DN14079_c0_g1_i1:113-787(+)